MTLATILIIVIGFVSCNTNGDSAQRLGEQNKAVVDRYLKSALAGDFKSMGETMADNYMIHGPAMKKSLNKVQKLQDWENFFKSNNMLKYDRINALAVSVQEGKLAGDWVYEWGIFSFTSKDVGLPVSIRSHGAYKLKMGKIEDITVYQNNADAMEQQGFKFVPPNEK